MRFVKKKDSSKRNRFVQAIGREAEEILIATTPRTRIKKNILASLLIMLEVILIILQITYLTKVIFYQAKIDSSIYDMLKNGESVTVYVTTSYRSNVRGIKEWDFRNYRIIKTVISSKEQLNALSSNREVFSIWKETTISPPPFPSVTVSSSYDIKHDPSRRFHGFTGTWAGKDVTIVVVDTGIDYTHPDFYDSNNRTIIKILISFIILDENDSPLIWIPYVNGSMNTLLMFDKHCMNRLGEAAFLDLNGHGTHVAGIIAGQGNIDAGFKGLAYGCNLIIVKSFDKNGKASLDTVLSTLEYLFEHVADFEIDIINMSWGAPLSNDGTDPLSIACSEIAELGVYLVASAGNYGNLPSTIVSPAISSKVLCIGAWDAYNRKIASFSSVGDPVSILRGEEYVKPDFLASGVMVVAPLSKYANITANTVVNNYYVALSGTSMSAPVASGIIAEWIEYYVSVFGKKPEREELLREIREGSMRINWLWKDFISGYGVIMAPQ